MIRMTQSRSAKQAISYFQKEFRKGDYYTNDQELTGRFFGKLAARLGIDGLVEKETFRLLSLNKHPKTKKMLTLRQKAHRTIGYDLTFLCPKSVSVLQALSKDDHLLKAFQESVRETMREIEKDSKTRVRKKNKDQDRRTGNLLWAEFVHFTARPVKGYVPDPHVHAHCFVFNLTCDRKERRYKACQFRDINRDLPYYQARYHKQFSDKLIALGYQIRRTRTAFEIENVPEPVLELFSKRTGEVEAFARKHNIKGAKSLGKLAARTRSKKMKGLTLAQLKQEWKHQINALQSSDGGHSDKAIRYARDKKIIKIKAEESVDHALQQRLERASVAQDRRILETAYRHALGFKGASVKKIDHAFQGDKRILRIKDGSRTLCTTKAVLKEEQKMISLASEGKGKFAPLYRKAPKMSLEGGQWDAACHVLTTTDQVSITMGRAGTGKTTLTKEVVKHIERAGKTVFFVAPTAEASRGVLRAEGFKEAETVAKLLSDKTLQAKLKNQILWVDEAGLLGVRDMTRLLELAKKHNARIIFSGDVRQHSSVVRGDALRVISQVAKIPSAEIAKIYRQKEKHYKEAVEALSQGQVKKAFKTLDNMGSLIQTDKADLSKRLVSDYMEAKKRKKSALVVCPTHAEGETVTHAIRHELKKTGQLDKTEKIVPRLINLNLTEAEKSDSRNYSKGQVIQFLQNRSGIKRGSRWKVDGISQKGISIRDEGNNSIILSTDKTDDFSVYKESTIGISKDDIIRMTQNGADSHKRRLNNGQLLEVIGMKDGKILARNQESRVEYQLNENFGHIAHAYCLTSHASQGKTCDHVLIAQPSETFPATNMKQFYVSVSRGREVVKIYTDDKEALLRHAESPGDRQAATELWGIKKTPSKTRLAHLTQKTSETSISNQPKSFHSRPRPCKKETKLVP